MGRTRHPSQNPNPSKNRQRASYRAYETQVNIYGKDYQAKLKRAGCFVMITNIDETEKPAREILKAYKGQYGVEKNFSFLKEPLIANDTFLKKPSRIDVLTFIAVSEPDDMEPDPAGAPE